MAPFCPFCPPGRLEKDLKAPVFDASGNVIDHLSRFVPGDPVLHFQVGRTNIRVEFDDENRVRIFYEYTEDNQTRKADGASLVRIENESPLFVELSDTLTLSHYSLRSASEVSGVFFECWVSVEADGAEIGASERLRLDGKSFPEKRITSSNVKGRILFAWHKQQETTLVETGIDYLKSCRLVLMCQYDDSFVPLGPIDIDVKFGVIPNTLSGPPGRVQTIGISSSLESYAKKLPETPGEPFAVWSESMNGSIVDPDNIGQIKEREIVIRVMCRDLVLSSD